jgi:hypothetical protein
MTVTPPKDSPSPRWSAAAFGVTILVSAFLLFQVQPLVSKRILPWFGGCPAVWTTCMLFFQVVLFAGYCYAHLLQRWLTPRRQVAVHLLVVAAGLALLPILPGVQWKPHGGQDPTWPILLLLGGTVGLPYFALSATSPLVQAWFSSVWPDRSPYRLYALSNAGSLAALLSYPFVFEPAFGLPIQSWLWSGAFVLYAILCATSLISVWRCASISPLSKENGVANSSPSITWLDRLRWIALPACASLLLLAVTNHVCQDVAAVPFLWVMPLSLYLLSFIICFEHDRWYSRRFWAAAVVFALLGVVTNDFTRGNYPLGLLVETSLCFAALFFACMLCHGELARLKPTARHLTEYYLMISAGGALGGLFVAVVAPHIFKTFLEWHIGIVASALLAVGLIVFPRRASKRVILCYVVLSPLLAAGLASYFYWGYDVEPPVDRKRNFFGVVTVMKAEVDSAAQTNTEPEYQFKLVHGRILHGCQFADPARQRFPTTYYGETSGVGRAILDFQKAGRVRVGAIGLGAGTLAAYAKPGDLFRFYEINPWVIDFANKHFTYLRNCRGEHPIVLGDARLSLEAEEVPQDYNVIVLDAFSSDSIPTHLLTVEAFECYRKHLAPNGVIAVHISNRYLRLAPVVRRLAEHFGMEVSLISDSGDAKRMQSTSDWVLVTRNKPFLKKHPSDPWDKDDLVGPLWTDQYSNLFQILKPPSSSLFQIFKASSDSQ